MSKISKTTTKAASPSASAAQEATKTANQKQPALSVIKDIQRQTRKQYSAEEKIRIVLEGLRGESSVAEICRREGLNTNGPATSVSIGSATTAGVKNFWKPERSA
jgi:transposase